MDKWDELKALIKDRDDAFSTELKGMMDKIDEDELQHKKFMCNICSPSLVCPKCNDQIVQDFDDERYEKFHYCWRCHNAWKDNGEPVYS